MPKQEIKLQTGIWYNDRSITLDFPAEWDVVTYWPDTPEALSEEKIVEIINSPIGQAPLCELAKGKRKVCIVVDDLTRPTPVSKVLPHVLGQLKMAGITGKNNLKLIVGTGTHGMQNEVALRNKIGTEGFESCEIIIHSDLTNTKKIGKTSFGTPVYVNKDVLDSDIVIGIGGVYPQHTAGFGGGAKLVLGILGRKSIMRLHFNHKSMEGKYIIDNDFRRDVTEMSRMIGLNTMFTVHVNAYLEVVNLMCGDHYKYYPEAAKFSKERYTVSAADDADVIIGNAYPLDTSFTFMRKGYKPLVAAPRSATKIMVSSNYEGLGSHGLFQHVNPSVFSKFFTIYRRVVSKSPKVILEKISQRIKDIVKPSKEEASKESQPRKTSPLPRNTDHLWVYHTENDKTNLPEIEDITMLYEWKDVIKMIETENSKNNIKVRIYPCAPLQCLDT